MKANYSFYALISRMKYILRWSLMRNTVSENVQEHSHTVAVIAHALAVIARDVYGCDINPDEVTTVAIYHDSSEILTGDLPTPIKYYDPGISDAYKNVETIAINKLLTDLPAELRPEYERVLTPDVNSKAYALVKAADKLAAYIKCVEEMKSGNPEFKMAGEQCLKKIKALKLPEADYFLEHFIPAFGLTLDELDFSIDNKGNKGETSCRE